MPENKQHKYDIFEEGDELPWHGDYATVVGREVVEEVPLDDPDVPDWAEPQSYWPAEQDGDVDFVLVEVLPPDASASETFRMPAYRLYREVQEKFDEFGMPSISASAGSGPASGSGVGINSPATGTNRVSGEEARQLAAFLREHAHFEPLYALFSGVESAEEVDDIADALDRAADAIDIANRVEA